MEDERKPKIRVLETNVISPFIPLRIDYSLTFRGIAAALCVQPVEDGQMGDIKADVIFMDRFKDTYKVENCCFLDFTKPNRSSKTYVSSVMQLDLPNHMCRCLESCNIIVKKYFYDTVLFEEVETELKEIPIENNVTNVDGISLLNELQTKQNANEMLEYIESIRDLLSEEIYSLLEKTLKTRWDMERMYGTNKKSTIAVLERILIS